ncbi:MAG TPA: hydantoinase/oxoprolinase family protein [Solirubrobacteraceae bacterium]|nr:hydantoinase/oxoprolinase family protein [Solirubrobacteraceae bacterium]
MRLQVGIDTGGTFTDLIALDTERGTLTALKTSSRPDAPGRAITTAFDDGNLDGDSVERFTHGTTVGTNALIERTGCKVGLLTTKGLEDTPYIQRINRKVLYDLTWTKPEPLVGGRRMCLGVDERLTAAGDVLRPVAEDDVRALCAELRAQGAEAVAICLLFAYLNTGHEEAVRRIVAEELGDIPVSVSHEVAPIWREYERANTTIADAYLKPLLRRYVMSLDEELRRVGMCRTWTIMKSNGGAMLSDAAAEAPVQTIMSGPAGGMIATERIAVIEGIADILTLDMGGTSADVGLIVDGHQRHTTEYEIEWGLPAAVPVIDVKSIGAGGGSIAWVDRGGFLRVGPTSAGAQPGPACYGRGGDKPTVTDANLVLGRLDPGFFLGGRMRLDAERSHAVLDRLGDELEMDATELAASIVEIANENMANAIKMVSLERGHDPRRFSLLAFGGAGPLHAAAVARSLDIPRVVIPPFPGVFSAVGLLLADLRVDKVWTQAFRSTDVDAPEVHRQFERITARAVDELHQEGFSGSAEIARAINMRYLGQNYEHEVPLDDGEVSAAALERALARFAEMHRQRYGYAIDGETIELVSFKVTAIGRRGRVELSDPAASGNHQGSSKRDVFFRGHGWIETTVIHRGGLSPDTDYEGPLLVQEDGSTTLVPPGMTARRSPHGSMILTSEDGR